MNQKENQDKALETALEDLSLKGSQEVDIQQNKHQSEDAKVQISKEEAQPKQQELKSEPKPQSQKINPEIPKQEQQEEKKKATELVEQGQIVAPETTEIKNLFKIETLFSTKTWQSFKKFTIPKEMLISLAEAKFPRPSKIQGTTIPLIRSEKCEHLIAQAKNGSGKTAAFVIGSLLRIDPKVNNTQVICVAHTRELVNQIGEVYTMIAKGMGITISANSNVRKEKTQVMVLTPAKAIDFFDRNKKLDMKCFIVDEADLLIEQRSSSDCLERILKLLLVQYKSVQFSFFSATMPQSARNIIVKHIDKANQISLEKQSQDLTIKKLQQYYMVCGQKEKPSLLQQLYSSMSITSTIVFVNTREYAVKLKNFLKNQGHSVSLIMGGDMHREQRDQIMKKFRDGNTKVLISTDLLARGIDVLQVSLVINYDIPYQINKSNITMKKPNFEGYLHRVGRTARYGREGIAITFAQNQIQRTFIKQIGNHYQVDIKELKREDVTKLISKAINDNKGKGSVNTVEGFLSKTKEGLMQDQPLRKVQNPEQAQKIQAFCTKIDQYMQGKHFPFDINLDDPSGNCYIQNPNAPNADPFLKFQHYDRSKEMLAQMGYGQTGFENQKVQQNQAKEEEESEEQSKQQKIEHGIDFSKPLEEADFNKEASLLPSECYSCGQMGVVKMCVSTIPHFKDIIIMAFNCDFCDYKTNEIKQGGGISQKGRKLTFNVQNQSDMNRDLFKSESCTLSIPELQLDLSPGTLGSQYTTVQGLLKKIMENLGQKNPFVVGDTLKYDDNYNNFQKFLQKLRDFIEFKEKFTLILDDPLDNCWIYSELAPKPDPQIALNFDDLSLSAQDTTTNTISTLNIQATISVDLAKTDVFQLEFPRWDFQNNLNLTYFTSQAPTCQIGVNGGALETVSCEVKENSSFQSTIKIKLGKEVASTNTISITAQNFRTPPTTAAVTLLRVSIKNQDLTKTYQASSSATLQVANPIEGSISIGLSPGTVNQLASYTFTINNVFFPDILTGKITFPSQIDISSASQVFATSTGVGQQVFTPNISGNTINLPQFITNNRPTSNVSFTINRVKNPKYAQQTAVFEVTLETTSGDKFLTSTKQTVTPIPAILQNASAIPQNTTVGQMTNYNINFQPSTVLQIGYKIKVTPPLEIALSSIQTQVCTVKVNLNSSCTQSDRIFTITVGDPPSNTSNLNIQLQITNLVNPLSVKKTSIFLIEVTNQNDQLLESTGNVPKVTASVAEITDINITPVDTVTTTQVVLYTFEFKTSGGLLKSGFNLQVQLPSEISFTNTANAASSCQKLQGFSSFTCSINSGSANKFISDLNFSQDYEGGPAAGLLKFSMNNFINPRSVKPVTFKFKITKSGYMSYQGQKSIMMVTPIALINRGITSNSNINGQLSEYSFKIISETKTLAGDYYQIDLPEAMQFNQSLECTDKASSTLTCTDRTLQKLYVQIQSQINATTQFDFKIANVYNPAGSQKAQQIVVTQCQKSEGQYFKISSFTHSQTYTSVYAPIPSISIQSSNSQIAQTSSYTFSIQSPVTYIPAGTIIIISFPIQFPQITGSVTCSGTNLIDTNPSCQVKNLRSVQIADGFPKYIVSDQNNKSITLTINSIVNGNISQQQTDNFGVTLKLSSDQIISQSSSSSSSPSNLKTQFTCNSNCLTCQNNPTQCLTCKQKSNSSFIFHHISGDKKCYQKCPAGFYNNQSNPPECSACNSPCTQCDTGPDSCTACDTSVDLFKYLNQNKCIQSCPDGKFERSNICESCDSKCQTCETSQVTCTSCSASASSRYLYLPQDDCLEICPDGFVGVGVQCDKCESPCATCSRITTQCTSCQNQKLLYSNGCVDSCPSNFEVNSDGNQCIKFQVNRDEVLYFIFLAFFVFLLIILAIIRAVMILIRFLKSLIALESLIEVISWVFLLAFLIRDQHWVSTTIVSIALAFHYLTNLILLWLIKRLKAKDDQFLLHYERYKCAHVSILVFSMIFSHKFYRFVVSFFFHQKKLNAGFEKKARFVKLLTYLTVISMFFTSLPIMFACCFNILFNTALLQLFYTDIQVFVITLIIVILEIIEACKEQKQLKQQIKDQRIGKYIAKRPIFQGSDFDISGRMDNTNNEFQEQNCRNKIQTGDISVTLEQVCREEAIREVKSETHFNVYEKGNLDNNTINNLQKSNRQQNNNYYIVEKRRSFPLSPKSKKEVQEQIQNQQKVSRMIIDSAFVSNKNNNFRATNQPEFSFDDDLGEVTDDSLPQQVERFTNQSFTEKRPGKIRETMPINVTPNRLNAAETQGPDEEDIKFQTPELAKYRENQQSSSIEIDLIDNRRVPRFDLPQNNNYMNNNNNYMNNNHNNNNRNNNNYRDNVSYKNLNSQQLEINISDLQAAGAIPKIQFSDQTVDYISDIDLNEKSTQRQLIDDDDLSDI